METYHFTFNQEVLGYTISREGYAYHVFNSQGVLLAHFQKHGENVNSASYCEVLLKLQDAIHRKRPGQLARGLLLIVTMPDPIQPEQPRREFKNYSGKFLNICLTSRTWPLVTFICLVCQEATSVADVSLMTKRLKLKYRSG
jgi:hypothetical protein